MSEMSTPLRVAAFVTALAATFALAWSGGRLVGPIDTPGPTQHREQTEMGSHDD